MNYFANPTRFLKIAKGLQPIVALIAVGSILTGLYYSLIQSPPDYQQSETVRMMYVHVPAAWMAMFCYVALAGFSSVLLIWRHIVADILAKSTAPIGACFTFLALATGSLWGKPMWGTWWVWDARLTSVLILFLLYLGYMVLYNAFDDRSRGARAAAILSIVGVINVPIIKFSVDWWNTLHQPASVIKMDGPAIHSSMLTPLILMAVGYTSLFIWILLIRARAELNLQKVHALKIRLAKV
ncbi:MAG: heme ABC transporter permease [Rhodospirillales bacterium]|nr:heme ABC transporter permease [Rhodospirillales bacterium]